MLQCVGRFLVHLDIGQVDVDADEISGNRAVYLVNSLLEIALGQFEITLHGVNHAYKVCGAEVLFGALAFEHVVLHGFRFLHGPIEMVEVDVVQDIVLITFVI